MNNFLKRIVMVMLSMVLAVSLTEVTAEAMTRKKVDSEISTINKKIKSDKKKLSKARKTDAKKLLSYIEVNDGNVYSVDPFVILIGRGQDGTFYHISNPEVLEVGRGISNSKSVNCLISVSDKTYDFYGTSCKEAKVVEKPHKADDISAIISKNTARRSSLKNSKKETISLEATYSVGVGQSLLLEPVFKYNTSDINKITWKSSNTNVVKVSKNGNLLGIAPGTATVSAKLSVTGKTYKTTVNVIAQ